MVETPETTREATDLRPDGAAVNAHELKAWFVSEVLPLEPSLMQFLRHNWRHSDDLADLRQDIYVRVFEAAEKQIPRPAKPFVFAVARNLLIDRYRRERIIPIDGVPDLEGIDIAADEPGPDRTTVARDELRRVQAALDQLPPRCREAVILRQVEGLSRREIANRMGIAEKTVKNHLNDGANLLIDILHGDPVSEEPAP
jgi:RNA polymerase sigma factor (sigma-70 family)